MIDLEERQRFTFSPRFTYIVRRNYLVWRKTMFVSLVGSLASPLLWLVVLGFGLGKRMIPFDGLSYFEFLASGVLCSSVMTVATSEALYAAFERWKIRRTWEGILNAPMSAADVVVGEWIWAGISGWISAVAVLLVMLGLGLVKSAAALWMLPVLLLTGLAFSGIGLIVIARFGQLRPLFFSLALMPLMAISGVFFPLDQLPRVAQSIAFSLPLSHAVALSRGLVVGAPLNHVLLHVSIIALYAGGGALLAVMLIRRNFED